MIIANTAKGHPISVPFAHHPAVGRPPVDKNPDVTIKVADREPIILSLLPGHILENPFVVDSRRMGLSDRQLATLEGLRSALLDPQAPKYRLVLQQYFDTLLQPTEVSVDQESN